MLFKKSLLNTDLYVPNNGQTFKIGSNYYNYTLSNDIGEKVKYDSVD